MSSALVIENAPVVLKLPALRKKEKVFYPETDGKPMGETDKHRKMMNNVIEPLERHFEGQEDVYVTGNILLYYVKGNNTKFISPDGMVVKGVGKGERRVFRLWDERGPGVVFEISSKGTRSEDFEKKLRLYEQFGTPEYYIFDPEQLNAPKAWAAFRLVNGVYQRVAIENGRIFSPELGLEIVQVGQTLRFFDPVKQEFLPTNEELGADNRQLKAARQQAELLIAQKDEEIARLLAKLEKLGGA